MQYCNLVFQKNETNELDLKIKKKIKFQGKRIVYTLYSSIFTGDHIYEIIAVINYVKRVYKQKIPITFDLGTFEFYDKLVYIILETICYYMINVENYDLTLSLNAKHTIWSEGIRYSPLLSIKNRYEFNKNFQQNIYMQHFRQLVPSEEQREKQYLSKLMQDVQCFLRNNGIEEASCEQLAEVIVELVGNAGEHERSECLLDLDVTQTQYFKKEVENDATYYGLNVVVMNYSPTLFHEPLKKKLETIKGLNNRYQFVQEAEQYHLSNLTNNYFIDDFYTISSFQHKISGNQEKNDIGGTGLTRLLHSLEEKADSHLCYMLSGNRVFFFEKEFMLYDENNLIGFNANRNFISEIPEESLWMTIKTFIPGVAYNLNFAIKKEWSL